MRVKHSKTPFPKKVSGFPFAGPVLLDADFTVTNKGRVYVKLLVFPNQTALQRFWNKSGLFDNSGKLERDSVGVAHPLEVRREIYTKGQQEPVTLLEVDPRYCAVIGLCAGYLSMNIVTHESVHAAFCFAARSSRMSTWALTPNSVPDETIAYPAGQIASKITGLLLKHGLYDYPYRKKK